MTQVTEVTISVSKKYGDVYSAAIYENELVPAFWVTLEKPRGAAQNFYFPVKIVEILKNYNDNSQEEIYLKIDQDSFLESMDMLYKKLPEKL
jgi:hypothetical protein